MNIEYKCWVIAPEATYGTNTILSVNIGTFITDFMKKHCLSTMELYKVENSKVTIIEHNVGWTRNERIFNYEFLNLSNATVNTLMMLIWQLDQDEADSMWKKDNESRTN